MPDNNGRGPVVTFDLVEHWLGSQTPLNVAEQAEQLILWLGQESQGPGHTVDVAFPSAIAEIGAVDWNGVTFIFTELQAQGLIFYNQSSNVRTTPGQAGLKFEGWREYERLRRGTADSSKAFMAMDYSNGAVDEAYRRAFQPAAMKAGFHLEKLDENPRAGLIDNRLRVEIRTSRFVVADLTDRNAGAYWEAGFAEGLGKPVIYTCEKGVFHDKKTHFDTNHSHTVTWESSNLESAEEELKNTIRATLPEEAKMSDD